MFDFEELEDTLPPEAYVVVGAGLPEVDGIYRDTNVQCHGAAVFQHSMLENQLLAREPCNGRFGWLLGASRRPLYGNRTEELRAPKDGWRAMKGRRPAPRVEAFSSVADASLRLLEIWSGEAEGLLGQGKFRAAADVYKRALGNPLLSATRKASLHASRARAFRMLAESKKKVPVEPKGSDTSGGEANKENDDPLHGLAAEWAIEEAELALNMDASNYTAAWEGAIAAKHIGWWHKSRTLAKKAMDASVNNGSADQERRERHDAASMLFLMCAEEEQEERNLRIREMESLREKTVKQEDGVDEKEIEWVTAVITDLNNALKTEDFKRPHWQLWKQLTPNTHQDSQREILEEIRVMVWEKWHPIAWRYGFRSSDTEKNRLCSRIVDCANTGRAPEVKKLIREIEDRVCIHWPDIPVCRKKKKYDEMWAYHRRDNGSWGTWEEGTAIPC